MNIVQAYIKFKGQYIILISGFSGSGKTKISRFIADQLNFQHVNISHFYRPFDVYDTNKNYISLKDGYKVLNWDNVYKSVDWDKLNDFVDKNKINGIVIVGFGFPKDLVKFNPDSHIHIKVSKKTLIENRNSFIEKHNTPGKDIPVANRDIIILNSVTYPVYLKLMQDSKIDKYINTNEMSIEKSKEEVFSYLMSITNKWLKDNSHKNTGHTINKDHMTNNKENNTGDLKDHINKQDKLKNNQSSLSPSSSPSPSSSSSSSSSSPLDPRPNNHPSTNKKIKKNTVSSSSDSSEDTTFLFTTDGRELIENSE